MDFILSEKKYIQFRDALKSKSPFLFYSFRYIKRLLLLIGTSLRPHLWRIFRLQRGVLVYVGLNRGDSFNKLFYRYKRAIGIEANPELIAGLKHRFRNYKNVELFNVAASDTNGRAFLTLPDNGNFAASATLDSFDSRRAVHGVRKIEVESVDLGSFLKTLKVDIVDSYISDCEGYDLVALKSCQDYLNKGKFLEIQCEVQKDNTPEAYTSVSNKEHMFDAVLHLNYEKIASGWTFLEDGIFNEVPNDWAFHDIKWKLKDSPI
jgi:FkbM family methyltransferase